MFGMLKMLPLLLVIGAGAYSYHNMKMSENAATIAQYQANAVTLQNNQARLESALERESVARVQAEENLQNQMKAIGELSEKNSALAAERDEYLGIFRRHDLTKLARVKPGLIEPRINKGTEEVFRSIESDSKEVSDADL